MKVTANLKRHDLQFQVGEVVYLKLQSYRQQSLSRRHCDKLSTRFYGPFEVLAHIDQVAYKLDLPPTSKIHSVFHVLQLKSARGLAFIASNIPPHLSSSLELHAEPEAFVGILKSSLQFSAIDEVMIKWKGLPLSDTTWEHFPIAIDVHFPHFHFEEKLHLFGAGNAMDPREITEAATK